MSKDTPFDEISIDDVDLDLVRGVTLSDVYAYMNYLSRDRAVHPNSADAHYGLAPAARARKAAAIRSFYKYLSSKAKLISGNPMQDLDAPRLKKTLPRYLNLDESVELLDHVDGPNQVRDYCILTLFLNCGLRVGELVGLNVQDVREDTIRVLGKGNKERQIYLNEACLEAIHAYLAVRQEPKEEPRHRNALFVSRNRTRLTTRAVENHRPKCGAHRRAGSQVLPPQTPPYRCHADAEQWGGYPHPPRRPRPRKPRHNADFTPTCPMPT